MSGSHENMTKETAETAKAHAEAAKAEIEAKRAEQELDEWNSTLARRRREEESRSAIAKSQKEASEAQVTQFSQLIPDLSKVQAGETKISGDQVIQGSALALRALEKAAAEVAGVIMSATGGADCTILVTSELDLATSDALFLDVRAGLKELEAATQVLLAPKEAITASPFESLPVLGVAGALSAAIPSALSLLAAHRNITTHAINSDDTSAAAAVAGALVSKGVIVLHDQFRVLAEGEIHKIIKRIRQSKQDLIKMKFELSQVTDEDPDRNLRFELVSALITAIESYLTAISTASSDGKRSALTDAVLREVLHDPSVPRRFAILVKGCGGSSAQLVNDKPFWSKDEFSVVASMGISYLLVDAENGRVAAAGVRSGSVSMAGKIGGDFQFKPPS
jgi:hypothetical protein